jgi:hypothetical protein
VHQAESIHQQMALAALDLLAAIKAALEPAPLDRLDGLAVQGCGGGLRIATSGPRDICSQVVVQLLLRAVVAPATGTGPSSAPRDEVTRDHPPLSATPGHVADGIDDRTQVGARPTKRFRRGQQRLQDCPLYVAQVRRAGDTRHALPCRDADCAFLTRPLTKPHAAGREPSPPPGRIPPLCAPEVYGSTVLEMMYPCGLSQR